MYLINPGLFRWYWNTISGTASHSKLTKRDLQNEHVVPGWTIFTNSPQLVAVCRWVQRKHFKHFFNIGNQILLERCLADLNQRLFGRLHPNNIVGVTRQLFVCVVFARFFCSRAILELCDVSCIMHHQLYPWHLCYTHISIIYPRFEITVKGADDSFRKDER